MDDERKRLIEEDRKIITLPPPDYSKMTNEQIRKRTQILEDTFNDLYLEDSTLKSKEQKDV